MFIKKCALKILICALIQATSLHTMINQKKFDQKNKNRINQECPICDRKVNKKCPYPNCNFVTQNKSCSKTGIKSHLKKQHMDKIDLHNFFSQCEKCKKCKNIFEEYYKKNLKNTSIDDNNKIQPDLKKKIPESEILLFLHFIESITNSD